MSARSAIRPLPAPAAPRPQRGGHGRIGEQIAVQRQMLAPGALGPEPALAPHAPSIAAAAIGSATMSERPSVRYEVDGRVAHLTLDRPGRGNAITIGLVRELSECVERADLDPAVHVLLLAGAGSGFCAGYDLVESAEGMGRAAVAQR